MFNWIYFQEAKWGRGSCFACVEQFWQPPVWAALILLCFGAGTWSWQGGSCAHFIHSVISEQTHPNLALLEVFWAVMGGKEGKKNLSWPHINCDLLENSRLDTQRLLTSKNCSLQGIDVCIQATAMPDDEATVSNLSPSIQITLFTCSEPALVRGP